MKKCYFLCMLMLAVSMLPALVACNSDDDDQDPSGMKLTGYGYTDGKLYYKITSETAMEVTVSKAEDNLVSADIPTVVSIRGVDYRCTSIGEFAFADCTALTSVNIPSSISAIDQYAFAGCSGLTSIDVPTSVRTLGAYAFYGCSHLSAIIIPSGVSSIGKRAFSDCVTLNIVTIPASVSNIGQYAFFGCVDLSAVHCKIKEPLANESLFSDDTYSTAILFVPRGALSAYQNALGWDQFLSIVEE